MTYVYVPSYQSLFLFLNEAAKHDQTVVPIVQTKNLETLLLELQCPYLWVPVTPHVAVGKIGSFIRNLVTVRKWCNTLDNTATLIFGYNSFDLFGFYFVKEWRRRGGTVFFKDLDPIREPVRWSLARVLQKAWWKPWAQIALFRFFGNLRHLKVLSPRRLVAGIDQQFLKYYGILPLPDATPNFMLERLGVMERFKLPLPTKAILYVADHTQTVVTSIEPNSLLRVLEKLPDEVWFKLHPRESRRDFYPAVKLLPDHIPAELLMSDALAVVSICSASLLQAAALPHKLTVSLLELVTWTDPAAKLELRRFLDKDDGDKRICYPRTFDELAQLLSFQEPQSAPLSIYDGKRKESQ